MQHPFNHCRALTAGFLSVSFLSGTALAAPDLRAQVRVVPNGIVIIPGSSIEIPDDIGRKAHTNIRIFRPARQKSALNPAPYGDFGNPKSMACIYGLVPLVPGCNPETLTANATGGSKVVVLVDAFDFPTATNDLSVFSAQYGLPSITAKNFQIVYGNAAGTKPAQDPTGGWELEAALDIEMAHSMAPGAKVVLVEATTDSYPDLLIAEQIAAGIATKAGGGEVSNSWGGTEFATEQSFDASFAGTNVVFFASTGDTPGVEVPAALHGVVAVGGTSVLRDQNGNYLGQSVWSETGGGKSAYIPRPLYQAKVQAIVGKFRGIPDVALVADPDTGVWIYDSTAYNGTVLDWATVGGTSVASPATAAIVNNAGHFSPSSAKELTKIYANLGVAANFTDITTGTCNNGSTDLTGWDYCTGVGTPLGRVGK
jgi:subtilase family serine protease